MTELGSALGGCALIGLGAAAILWFGWKQGFFRWIPDLLWNRRIALFHPVSAFAVYFLVSLTIPRLYVQWLQPLMWQSHVAYAAWVNFLLSATMLAALFALYCIFARDVRNAIWRAKDALQPYSQDFKMSFFGWCLAFPLVLFVNQTLEAILYHGFGLEQLPDQLAVQFVKMTADHPLYFTLAILSVVLFAPLIEEFLFRGLLQSFIRKHLGSKQAIVITALCFSFFHFSPEQSYGNIAIIGSLFPLALFLGFLYEKQRSLAASIGLHSMFNAMSILNLYFMGGIPCA